jgi:hypothetical protein
VNEEAVNTALQEHNDFIIQNITSIVKDTVDGQDAEISSSEYARWQYANGKYNVRR